MNVCFGEIGARLIGIAGLTRHGAEQFFARLCNDEC